MNTVIEEFKQEFTRQVVYILFYNSGFYVIEHKIGSDLVYLNPIECRYITR